MRETSSAWRSSNTRARLLDIVDIFQSPGPARVSMPRLASQLPPPATPSARLIRAERYHLREFPTHSRDSSCPRMPHTRGRSSAKPRPIDRCAGGVLSHRRQVVCFVDFDPTSTRQPVFCTTVEQKSGRKWRGHATAIKKEESA